MLKKNMKKRFERYKRIAKKQRERKESAKNKGKDQ
jgi:hypothetical protein